MANQPPQGASASQSSSKSDPALQQMAADLHEIRRKQAIDFYAPGIGLLIFIALGYWFLHA